MESNARIRDGIDRRHRLIARMERVVDIAPSAYNPERYYSCRLLWVKVILRAAFDYALWRTSKNLHLRKHAVDAERWLFEPSSLMFSFENLCFAFNFPKEKLRSWARSLTRDGVKKYEYRERSSKTDLIAGLLRGEASTRTEHPALQTESSAETEIPSGVLGDRPRNLSKRSPKKSTALSSVLMTTARDTLQALVVSRRAASDLTIRAKLSREISAYLTVLKDDGDSR